MANRKRRRSTAEIARDRKRIAEMYLRGELQADIGKEMDLAQSTISRDLVALHGQWRKSAAKDISEAKSRELAKVDNLELTYWDAWERSCEDAETVRQQGDAEGVDKITKTSKGQAGDPRFLTGVQWCIEKRCKILGIDAPIEQRHTGTGEKGEMLFRYVDNLGPDVI